ncbi:MAG TPA: thioredoxin domain-containing protein [Gaiellaceae bacterium]|nr:thioredoxin domain-containing protein [Gaiellaceae bacterium]
MLAAVGAILLAGVLIGVSVAGSGGGSSSSVTGAAATNALIGGIPQNGFTLGSPKAPVRMVEYGDLQCPICREYAASTLPTIVREYVRTGKVQLEFRGLAFLGPDSQRALEAVTAAAGQNKGWNMLDLLYRNQGEENTGWVTDSKLEAAAAALPGLSIARWQSARSGQATQDAIQSMHAQALALMGSQIRTPTFEVARRGQPLQYLPIQSLDASAFTPALDQLLAQ